MADDNPQFSIQKHEAIEFHYVFRLQVGDDVLSWVVPKGPSPDPRIKRLAIPVDEDLPIDFEGVADRAGKQDKVIVWDSGPYTMPELDGEPILAADGLRDGKLEFDIQGAKLKGGFTLLRIEEDPHERWILMKNADIQATSRRNPVVTEPLSVLTGRDLGEVTSEHNID